MTAGAVDGANPSNKFPLFPVATTMPAVEPYFYYVAGFRTAGPVIPTDTVPATTDSWSGVKSLYR